MTPQRIQRRRTAGWRMPDGAVFVGRPTRWGNPFRLGTTYGLVREPGAVTGQPWEYEGRISGDGNRHDYHHPDGTVTICHVRYGTAAELVELYRRALLRTPDEAIRMAWGNAWGTGTRGPVRFTVEHVRRDLAGRDLACWCPLDQPCHADVLLEVANGGAR